MSMKSESTPTKGAGAQPDAFSRYDFIWKNDSNDWHLKRGEQIRKKYGPQISKLEGNDPTSLINFTFASILHWVIAVSVGHFFGHIYLVVVLLGWLIGGYFTVGAGLAMHECSH